MKVDDTRGTCLPTLPMTCSTRSRQVTAKAGICYSTSQFHAQPLLGGQSPTPWRSESPLQAQNTHQQNYQCKENRVCSSLLLSARHKSMSTGPYFWDRHPFDISAHALPPRQHLAPPFPAVSSVVTLCGCPRETASAEVRCLFPLAHVKPMHGLAASLFNSNTGGVEVSPGKLVHQPTRDKGPCICSSAGLNV